MARAVNLPPYPAQAQPGDYIWVDWWRQLQQFMRDILKDIEEMQYLAKMDVLGGLSSVTVVASNMVETFTAPLDSGVLVVNQGICQFSFLSKMIDTTTDDGMAPNPMPATWYMDIVRASALPEPFINGVGCWVKIYDGLRPDNFWEGFGTVYGSGSIQITANPSTPLYRSPIMYMMVSGTFPVRGL